MMWYELVGYMIERAVRELKVKIRWQCTSNLGCDLRTHIVTPRAHSILLDIQTCSTSVTKDLPIAGIVPVTLVLKKTTFP